MHLRRRVSVVPERSLLKRWRRTPERGPIFVVGAPRSGTTVAYLMITTRYVSGFLPNLSKRWPNNQLLAVALASRMGSDRARSSLENVRGEAAGAMAPSDGWTVFHRWFGRYDARGDHLTTERLHEFQTIAWFAERWYGGPFVNKNNDHATRIPVLAELFPHALFVNVVRARPDAVLSLCKVRESLGVPTEDWWATATPEFSDETAGTQLRRAVITVLGAQRHIERELSRLPADRYLTVGYPELALDPDDFCSRLESSYLKLTGDELAVRGGWTGFNDLSTPRSVADADFRLKVAEVEESLLRDRG